MKSSMSTSYIPEAIDTELESAREKGRREGLLALRTLLATRLDAASALVKKASDFEYGELRAQARVYEQIIAEIEEALSNTAAIVATQPPPKKCPLPRIGSKDWGWESCSTISIYGVSRPTHRSKLTRYSVYEGVNYCVVIVPDRHDGSRRIGSELSLRDAKTLAEALARRDWRKENRKR